MHPGDPVELVAKIPLFDALPAAERQPIARLIRVQRHAPRDTVAWEGDPGGTLFFILSGYLKAVSSGAEGREVLLSVMGPGEVVGELSVLDGQPRSASIIALEPTELAALDREPLLALIRQQPSLAIGLLEVLTQRLRKLTTRCENISSMDIPSRLAEMLVALAERHGQSLGKDVRIPVRLSQQDFASMVGATRESVNKQLKSWEQAGLLHHEGGRLTIHDLRGLRALCALSSS
jgi:CRP-like cAMP-binding protein